MMKRLIGIGLFVFFAASCEEQSSGNSTSKIKQGVQFHKPQKFNESKETENVVKLLAVGSELVFDNKLLEQSKEQNKPLLLYFTGFSCVNCRKIEQMTLNDDIVFNLLNDDFIFLPLYVDNRTELAKSDQVYSSTLRRTMTTIGDKNMVYEIEEYNASSQPLFVCLNSKGEIIGTTDYAKSSKYPFEDFLRDCLKKVNNK